MGGILLAAGLAAPRRAPVDSYSAPVTLISHERTCHSALVASTGAIRATINAAGSPAGKVASTDLIGAVTRTDASGPNCARSRTIDDDAGTINRGVVSIAIACVIGATSRAGCRSSHITSAAGRAAATSGSIPISVSALAPASTVSGGAADPAAG